MAKDTTTASGTHATRAAAAPAEGPGVVAAQLLPAPQGGEQHEGPHAAEHGVGEQAGDRGRGVGRVAAEAAARHPPPQAHRSPTGALTNPGRPPPRGVETLTAGG